MVVDGAMLYFGNLGEHGKYIIVRGLPPPPPLHYYYQQQQQSISGVVAIRREKEQFTLHNLFNFYYHKRVFNLQSLVLHKPILYAGECTERRTVHAHYSVASWLAGPLCFCWRPMSVLE